MTPERRLAVADAWARAAEALAAASPTIARHLAERPERDWRGHSATERQVLLAAAVLRLDPAVSATRRRLRALVAAREEARAHGSGTVAEDGPTDAQFAAVRDEWLAAAGSPALPAALAEAAGPAAALRAARKQLKGLPEAAAVRFLRLLPYPAATADPARLRWLGRMGLIDPSSKTRREDGPRALAELAELTAAPLDTVDLLLGAFTGAEKVDTVNGWCLARPRCGSCPMAPACPASRTLLEAGYASEAAAEPSRSLAATMLPQDRPREKLAARGGESLTDAELVAILLRTGGGGDNAVTLANRLIAKFGSLDRVADASVAEISRLRGLGPVKAITVKAALELARRLERRDPRLSGTFSDSKSVFQFLRGEFLGKKQEAFVALLLNQKSQLIRMVKVTEGTLTQSLVHPREAFKEAIRDAAASVIFAHNHPSGDPAPSRDDRLITGRLVKAGELVGVRVLDHIVVGRDSYYSFADDGRLAPE
ncbi:MAG: DNA repair protein RadC [Candidatus Sumerlaeia bacterium]|nr:DNA repair protein RadC [Candidatus Sumerlaeia bacterium]